MLDRIIVNIFYLVPYRVYQYKKGHPDVEVLIADGTKARKAISSEIVQYEMGWVTARRGILMLTTKELVCGDWTIRLPDIQDATLMHISGGSLLKITTKDGEQYQFGMQRNSAWEKQELFPLRVEESALRFSKASLIIRLVLLVWLAYLIGLNYLRNGLNLVVILLVILLVWTCSPLLRLIRYPKVQ